MERVKGKGNDVILCKDDMSVQILFFHFHVISPFFPRETTFMTSCLLPWMMYPFKMGFSLERKNLIPIIANSFL